MWPCAVCEANAKIIVKPVYTCRRNLAEHMFFKHPLAHAAMVEAGDATVKGIHVRPKVKCGVCGVECKGNDLKKHMRRHHPEKDGGEGGGKDRGTGWDKGEAGHCPLAAELPASGPERPVEEMEGAADDEKRREKRKKEKMQRKEAKRRRTEEKTAREKETADNNT